MAELGKYTRLPINRFVDFGAYLDGGELGEILIPLKYLPEDVEVDDEVEVFVHLDGEERYIATTEEVLAEVGESALMEIVAVSDHGAFADWGLVKNLFIPFREQKDKLYVGDKVVVHVYLDEMTVRIAGSTRISKHLAHDITNLEEKEQVRIMIWRETPSGFLAIIENRCLGMLYHNQIFKKIAPGDEMLAYIKKIRSDEKIDLILQEEGYQSARDFSHDLEDYMVTNKESDLHDKSDPEKIKAVFGVSKKVFKKAVGKLYKEGVIQLVDQGIKLHPDYKVEREEE